MELMGNIAELQKASDYRLMHKFLRPGAIGSIVFGVIAIALGFAWIDKNPINIILALIGIFLFVEGILVLIAPAPKKIIAAGLALLLVGGWNISITIYNISAGGKSFFWAILGFWQIIWAFQAFGRYRRFSGLSPEKPSEEYLKWIGEVVKSVKKAKVTESDDIIEFRMLKDHSNWKGKLLRQGAIFVEVRERDVLLAKTEDIQFVPQGKGCGGTSEVSFQIANRTGTGEIPPESFEKYEAWKQS
ncbi:hypothetical protein KAX22_09645 [bacterium]|nr:hypothetical protein [bacterium]